jgi:hypothetical protein
MTAYAWTPDGSAARFSHAMSSGVSSTSKCAEAILQFNRMSNERIHVERLVENPCQCDPGQCATPSVQTVRPRDQVA